MSTVGSDEELRTGENEANAIYIKEEFVINETQCVDELDIKESRLLYKTENNIEIKEEYLTPGHNGDIEFYYEYVKKIKCDSDVSVSRNEDILYEDSKYSNSNSKTNKLTKSTQNNVTEKNIIKKINKFQCAIYSREYPRKILLKYHLKAHAGIRDYKCLICSKKFILKYDLVRHEKIHTSIKNYECLICKKKFMHKGDLTKHNKIHTDTRNYECALCKKKFIQRSSLVTHEKIHINKKNYECLICKKKFIQRSSLSTHEKIHINKKNYECSVCKKKFMYKSDLVRHGKTHSY